MDKKKDLHSIIDHFIRFYYESKSNRHFAVALKHIIVQFSSRIFNSFILSYFQDFQLYNLLLLKLNLNFKPKLLYRASAHSFDKKIFHQLCDNHGATLTIIQSQNYNIFGIYADVPWPKYKHRHTRHTKYKKCKSNNICLFSLQSNDPQQNTPIIMRSTNRQNYIASHPDLGPTVGSGIDKEFMELCVDNQYHQCYMHRSKAFDYSGMNSNLSEMNSQIFNLLDYEVFELV